MAAATSVLPARTTSPLLAVPVGGRPDDASTCRRSATTAWSRPTRPTARSTSSASPRPAAAGRVARPRRRRGHRDRDRAARSRVRRRRAGAPRAAAPGAGRRHGGRRSARCRWTAARSSWPSGCRDVDPRTEVGQVASALNQMLDNVGGALEARQDSEMRLRQFIADASHELRTPLAAIRGYAELTRRGPARARDRVLDRPDLVADRADDDAGRRPAAARPPRRGTASGTRRRRPDAAGARRGQRRLRRRDGPPLAARPARRAGRRHPATRRG